MYDELYKLTEKADENTDQEMYECFESKDILNQKLALADIRIQTANSDYEKKKWILNRITVMKQIGAPENEFVSYCSKYYDDAAIRRELVNYYVESNKAEEAINVLSDSL